MAENRQLTLPELEEARSRLAGILYPTKTFYSDIFSAEAGKDIYIKPENLQITGSFKIRGAFNKISQLSASEKAQGIIASSAGNHAQGVAFSANRLGVQATIVMPNTTPLIKVEGTRKLGAEVVLAGNSYDEAFQAALVLQEKHGYVFIHPFNDWEVIVGQGTIAAEILEEIPDVNCIVAPIGGGGLISGVALAAKLLNPDIKVIGVEPEGAQSMKQSIACGKITPLRQVKTVADGVAVKTPGELTFDITRRLVDDIITVNDYDTTAAMLLFLERHKQIGENSGVLTLAALSKLPLSAQKVACIVSGGNIDVVTISSIINNGLISRGRLFCFSVELPDKPGELLKVAQILSNLGANVIQLDHNQFKAADRLSNVVLEVTAETNGHGHVEQIIHALQENDYIPKRVY
jgi:threonine dehydratase